MDSILSCMTAGHNIYTINRERKQPFLTNPQLVPHLYKKTTIDSQSDYYAPKQLSIYFLYPHCNRIGRFPLSFPSVWTRPKGHRIWTW
jgi:hypothetical protein